MEKKQRISNFINSLSNESLPNVLLPVSNEIIGEGKNPDTCVNSIMDCEGSSNGTCSNYTFCDGTVNKKNCLNFPDLETGRNWQLGCGG